MNEAMKPDGLNVIAVLIIASFAIDRIVAGLLFILSWVEPWAKAFPACFSPPRRRDAQRYRGNVVGL